LFTLIIGFLIFSTKTTKWKFFGVILGLIGAIVLTLAVGQETGTINNQGIYGLFIVAATICYGFSVNLIKEKLNHISPTLLSSISFSFLLPLALVLFFYTDTYSAIIENPNSWEGLGYISILSIFGTFLASILFYKMVQRTNAVFGSSVTYLIPIISIFWGLMDGELFTSFHILGMFLILAGVFLSRKS
jgi:drug/metabolite transporter (DMT)-like permease